jgi:hypothetical protein
MTEFVFADGSQVRSGDLLTHPDRTNAALAVESVGGWCGSWSMTFSVTIDGRPCGGGSCMGCEAYTRDRFLTERLPAPPAPAPEPELAPETCPPW